MKNFIMAIVFIATKLKKTLPEILSEVERLAVDGVISSEDRKKIATKAVRVIANEFGVKMGWIPRIIVSILINKISKKLPSKDIVVEDVLNQVVPRSKKDSKKSSKNNFAKKRK